MFDLAPRSAKFAPYLLTICILSVHPIELDVPNLRLSINQFKSINKLHIFKKYLKNI